MNEQEINLLDSVNVPTFALELNSAGQPVYVAFNKVAREAANVSLAQISNKTALELYPGAFGKVAFERHSEVLASGTPSTYELTLPLNGEERHVRTHLVPVLDSQGQVKRLIGTSEDITSEYRVREAEANSLLLNTELEEYISLAALDLHSPINNVSALADLIREDFQDLGDGKLELINMLESVASKAMELISDVLSHARTAGSSEAIEEFELTGLCEEILLLLDPTDQHLAQIEACRIFGDRIATQIVLRNLMDSAIKNNDGKPIELAVTAEAVDEQNYQITVVDEGLGFSATTLDFLDGGEYRKELGDGLLGVRRLISARGGCLSAERAASGRGAIVKFTLPGALLGVSYLSPMAT